MANQQKSFYQRLTRLFRSGPAIRRKVKGQDYKNFYDNQVVQNNLGYYGASGFKREASPFSVMGAYGILDRNSRYAEFAEMENCLHGDTKIAVPGGYKTLKELTEEYGLEKDFIVYSYDHKKGAIFPAVARQARHTTTTHAYRVKFDNGKEIIGTEDHRLMKRDGTYCEIRDLKSGDAMMPFYRRSLVGKKTGPELQKNCYQVIYTMNKEDSPSRWISEHRLLGKFITGKGLAANEVVHHKNFQAHDNRLENLELMTLEAHQTLHAKILNGKKWDKETNSEWISEFKKRHSAWMKENNPAERKDIKFERILQWCDENGYNLHAVARAFDTDLNTIKRKLKLKGFNDFISFAKAYCVGWKPYNGENKGSSNNRYRSDLTFEAICNAYTKGLSKKALAKKLNSSVTPINARLKEHKYSTWSEFASTYQNLKVESIEYYGITDLYDITVDGYKNFATDSLIAHNTAEIATALNVYADESCATDEKGKTFHIYSENAQVQKALEELFYEVVNIEFNARRMVRNLVKNGDYFCYVEVVPDFGVINVEPLPVNEIEREEGFDKHDPYAVRYRLITRGGKYLENWQMLHFRILGNDLFLPYGTSFLESARRSWRQLTMMEDAMMVYRLVRSPERRVFYIDVSAVHPNDIPSYMEAVKEGMRGASVIEQQQGRQDFRYNPLPVHKDTGIPLLDGRTITIEELAKEYDAGKENWVYSIQDSSLGIVPGKVAWCGKNYTANKLIKITLDDGTSLKTAPEHPYVLRDGSSVRADQLIPGMSLMPLYREITDKGYERCYNPETQKYETTHSLVAKNFYQNEWQNTARPVVHHKCPWERETNKRNNSPKNLEVMNFWEHRELHAKMIEHTLLRPEILEENSRRLTRYNRSKLHSSRVSLNNIKYQKGQKLSQLYNGSDLHKEHNEIRKNAQFNSWLLNKAERCQAMKFKFTEKCLDIAKDIMAANPTISRDDFGAKLKNNIDFVTAIKEANSNTKRQNKIPNHRLLAQNISNYAGFDSYVEFKNSFSSAQYLNHKISTVETVTETVDVYCMTVIGPNGEEDRHNFAAMSNDESGNYNKKMSAVFLKNSVDEDYFLPTRPNNQTKIESIAGGQNTTATEDVEYIQKKLIAALMVPKAYLTYDEAISCLVGETQIPLLDGSSPTIKELSDKFANGELTEAYCYSTLLDGTVVPGKINKAWATKKVNSTYRIHLDNGEYIDCTENHPFLLKNGVYKRADELTVNDSLMPVYKKLSSKQDKDLLDGYEMVFDNKTGEWKYTHKMVSDWQAENNGGYTIGKQRVVHHIDFNKLNNSPKNLQEMTWHSHRKLHSQNLSSTILRPDVMIKREPSRLAALSASRHRNIKSRQMKQQMNDPKSALRSWVHGEEIKQVVSRNMKAAWSTDKYRSIKTKQNKEILQRPEVREKLFGKNHWAARATKHFDLNWLVEYCKQNNVTEYLHFRKSSQNNSPCSSRVVGRIFRENNISGWREFEKQYLCFNHKVIRIEIKECGDEATQGVWVYDLEVEKTHNFLVKQGVVVHNSKSTLAQEDIRFSRTIATLQKIMIAELNKLAIIHLYALGFSGDDLLNFELKFSNPSTVAVQQKLALVSQKIEIAAKAWEVSKETGIMSMPYIQKEILGLRPEEINQIRLESRQDQIAMAELKKIAENPPFDNSLDSNIDIFDKGNYSVPSSPFAPDPKQLRDIELKNQEDELALRRERKLEKEKNGESSGAPIKLNPTPNLDKAFRRNKRSKEFTGASALAMPNFKDMLDITNNRYSKDPYDTQSSNYTRKFVLEESQIENELLGRGKLPYKISKEMQSTLKTMNESMKRDFEIKGIELVNEKSSEDQSDMLFLIEKDLKTE